MVLVGCKQAKEDGGRFRYTIDKEDFCLRYDPSTHPDFIVIEPKYADKEGMMLQKDLSSISTTCWCRWKAGHLFCILSATRNFSYQKSIYGENKWYGFSNQWECGCLYSISGWIRTCQENNGIFSHARVHRATIGKQTLISMSWKKWIFWDGWWSGMVPMDEGKCS